VLGPCLPDVEVVFALIEELFLVSLEELVAEGGRFGDAFIILDDLGADDDPGTRTSLAFALAG